VKIFLEEIRERPFSDPHAHYMNLHGPKCSAERGEAFVSYERKKSIKEYYKHKESAHEPQESTYASSAFKYGHLTVVILISVCLLCNCRGVKVYFQGFQEKYSDFHLKKLVTKHQGKVK
jgi:hypothetical protein